MACCFLVIIIVVSTALPPRLEQNIGSEQGVKRDRKHVEDIGIGKGS